MEISHCVRDDNYVFTTCLTQPVAWLNLEDFANVNCLAHRVVITIHGKGVSMQTIQLRTTIEQLPSFPLLVFNNTQHNQANPNAVGTGGTPFMTYLQKHRDETKTFLL
jgi:hypothetical protein